MRWTFARLRSVTVAYCVSRLVLAQVLRTAQARRPRAMLSFLHAWVQSSRLRTFLLPEPSSLCLANEYAPKSGRSDEECRPWYCYSSASVNVAASHDQWRCRLAARAAKVQRNLLWYRVGAPSFTIWRRAGRRSGIDHSSLGCS